MTIASSRGYEHPDQQSISRRITMPSGRHSLWNRDLLDRDVICWRVEKNVLQIAFRKGSVFWRDQESSVGGVP